MSKDKEKIKILVVDDSQNTLELLQRNLSSRNYHVHTALGVSEALAVLDSIKVDLVITDLKMPKASGMELVRHVRENLKETEVMMITGYATVNGAVKAIKGGAEEYLSKPFTDDELFCAVERALAKLDMRKKGECDFSSYTSQPYGLLGESQPMKMIFAAVEKAAKTSANVLIFGESGSGKELVARAIHYGSKRASFPFVPVNCGGIPEGLLESELFGHVKGAFTGAVDCRAGFFQTADGGTIFLDEIGEMTTSMQVKLLRVLQDQEVYMVGATKSRKVDVRIMAATNKDLQSLLKKGLFREDLYFRLNVINVFLPPLRERGDDILFLVNYFAKKYSKEFGKDLPKFSDDAMNLLKNYYWPGNVRELENLIQRLTVMSEEDVLDIPDLPSHMRYVGPRNNFNRTLAQVETEYVKNVLESVNGNKTKASEILGIDRKTLREKLKIEEEVAN